MCVLYGQYLVENIFQIEGGGVTFVQEKIVQWLNTMRMADGGFVSTIDTIVALQALVTYSYNSRIKVLFSHISTYLSVQIHNNLYFKL